MQALVIFELIAPHKFWLSELRSDADSVNIPAVNSIGQMDIHFMSNIRLGRPLPHLRSHGVVGAATFCCRLVHAVFTVPVFSTASSRTSRRSAAASRTPTAVTVINNDIILNLCPGLVQSRRDA